MKDYGYGRYGQRAPTAPHLLLYWLRGVMQWSMRTKRTVREWCQRTGTVDVTTKAWSDKRTWGGPVIPQHRKGRR